MPIAGLFRVSAGKYAKDLSTGNDMPVCEKFIEKRVKIHESSTRELIPAPLDKPPFVMHNGKNNRKFTLPSSLFYWHCCCCRTI